MFSWRIGGAVVFKKPRSPTGMSDPTKQSRTRGNFFFHRQAEKGRKETPAPFKKKNEVCHLKTYSVINLDDEPPAQRTCPLSTAEPLL